MSKKTPTRILEARGAFRKHPERRRHGEPVVTEPLGGPPESFAPDEVTAWRQIVERAPVGVLTAADWLAVVMASKLFAEFMRDSGAMNAARISRVHSLLGDMGLTPSARASLSLPEPKTENPFNDLDS